MQQSVLTEQEICQLLNVSILHQRPIVVDWVNRTISILSEEKINPKVILSDGPMKYRDILFEIRR